MKALEKWAKEVEAYQKAYCLECINKRSELGIPIEWYCGPVSITLCKAVNGDHKPVTYEERSHQKENEHGII